MGKNLRVTGACWPRLRCSGWRIAGRADSPLGAELGRLGIGLDFLIACGVEGTLSPRLACGDVLIRNPEEVSDMKRLVLTVGVLGLFLYLQGLSAGNMRCGGEIIEDGQTVGPYKEQIRELCGPPTYQSGDQWIYVYHGTANKVLDFNDDGQLEAISDEYQH